MTPPPKVVFVIKNEGGKEIGGGNHYCTICRAPVLPPLTGKQSLFSLVIRFLSYNLCTDSNSFLVLFLAWIPRFLSSFVPLVPWEPSKKLSNILLVM
jgi:hypothetical protein